ncbi:Acyl-CoA hydrolase [uncultured Sporomusa sp.]|uniref:Acyl-CoA hydrolase n=1 Tax=uncultured Sporomusa sp. TaxID=307249 RepID=A0A212LWA9_9FIRM|nr:acyl-CoA thioesterase [uncultured Sporomusa sp.]SCM81904.1 Acyl-CoA hydrolase [uncultured Sporomusa sp.]
MYSKTVAQSKITIGNLMQPMHVNQSGRVHGGEIMKLMDQAAGIAALKHARQNVVTARVDNLEFHKPVYVSNLVTCEAYLTFVGKTSMEVAVTVLIEDLFKSDETVIALTALFTMVALDKNGKPSPVPTLTLENDEQRVAFEAGRQRYLTHRAGVIPKNVGE